MKTFKNLEEIKPYYNEKTNTYEFFENKKLLDVELNFDLNVDSNIHAYNINACNISACDINACNISACDINAGNINACNISACDINAVDIKASDINACNIKARDINACNIKAVDIKARDINAVDIKARDINFYAVCFAYKTFVCKSIKGERPNSKHFCLDSEIVIKGDKKKC